MKIVIAGRSRSGKDLLAKTLVERLGLKRLKTHTDRPRRYPDEDLYYFHTKEESASIPFEDKLFLTESVDGHQRWTTEGDMLEADFAILDFLGVSRAIELWQTHGYEVALLYVHAKDDDRLSAHMKMLTGAGVDVAKAGIEVATRERIESPQFTLFEDALAALGFDPKSTDAVSTYTDAGLDATQGADELIVWRNGFDGESLDTIVGHLATRLEGDDGKPHGGYHKFPCAEPFILEPEDWTRDEWAVLCKLCGLVPGITSRIRLDPPCVECYVDPDEENEYAEGDD